MAGYLGASPVPQTIQKKQSFTATASQTTFTTTGYTDGQFINVYLNGVRLINGTDYTATNGSDIVLTTGASASDVLDFETFNEFTLVDQTLETPTFRTSATLKNDTEEDTDGGRESTLIFKGEQSGGEISTLAEIEASHDGTADDEKGDLIFRTNDGSDGSSPTEAMRITSQQRLGIGTNDPQELVHLKGADPSIRFEDTSGDAYAQIDTDSADEGTIRIQADPTNVGANSIIRFDTDGSERMRINADGRVGIGVAPSTIGTVNASLQANQSFLINYSDNTTSLSHNVYFDGTNNVAQSTGTSSQYYQSAGLHVWRNAPSVSAGATATLTERMRIDTSGNVLFGTTTVGAHNSNSASFYKQYGQIYLNHSGHGNGTYYAAFTNGGSIIGSVTQSTASSVAYNTTSDYRLKENVTDVTDGITRVKQLDPKRFNFIAEPDSTVDGFLAHEVQTVVPEAVTGTHNEVDDDGNPVHQGIDQSKLVPLLTAALQEAIAKIETLETKVAALEAE